MFTTLKTHFEKLTLNTTYNMSFVKRSSSQARRNDREKVQEQVVKAVEEREFVCPQTNSKAARVLHHQPPPHTSLNLTVNLHYVLRVDWKPEAAAAYKSGIH